MRTTAAFLFAASAWAGTIEQASVERVSPGQYQLVFAPKDAGTIQVYADSTPGAISAKRPLAKLKSSPATLNVNGADGRLYFHLKPQGGPTRTVATRSLNLEGAANFRDLGGYQTTDGRWTKWGLVYRSNNLASLTERDYNMLAAAKIKLVCDFRVQSERTQQPTQWRGQPPEFFLAPIGSDDLIKNASATFLQNNAASQSSLVSETRGYEQFVTEYSGQYEKIFHRLANGETPLVFHCSAGRDRTGTFAALLLTMLNVPRETVVEDYLLTGKYLLSDAAIDKMASDLQKSMGLPEKPSAALLRERLAMKREVMDSTFRVIDEHYGSFENFRKTVLHISDAELARMRELLTEP